MSGFYVIVDGWSEHGPFQSDITATEIANEFVSDGLDAEVVYINA